MVELAAWSLLMLTEKPVVVLLGMQCSESSRRCFDIEFQVWARSRRSSPAA